ncbi:MAG TPA: hypothetical protein PKV72_00210 [Candidatus Peribacteria bacterium]|nr:hypothetical protein [Candidatus Peribacteria bacterium]
MSRKSRNLEGQTGTDVAVLEAPVVDHALEADLAHVKGELTTVLAGLLSRPDLQGGDGEVMAVRVRASLNGAVAEKPELGDAVQGVLAARWESISHLPAGAAADTIVSAVRKRMKTAAAVSPSDAPVVPTRADTANAAVESAPVAVDENPALTRLMGYIDELRAPEDAKAVLRRDIGGLGKQLKDSRVATTARKSIVKTAKKFPGNEALVAKLG